MEHGLEYITFYVQKHTAPLVALFWFPAGSRRAARSARICETPFCRIMLLYHHQIWKSHMQTTETFEICLMDLE